MTTETRCAFSDMIADQCADVCCAPDALVYLDQHPTVRGEPAKPRKPARPVALAPRPTHLLGRVLQDTIVVYDQLGELLTGFRTGSQGEAVTGGGGLEKPMPIRDQVAEHRHQLLHDLRWWSRWVLDETGVRLERVKRGSEVEVAVAILLACTWLPDHDDAQTLLDIMLAWHRRARVLSDLPVLRTQLPVALHADLPAATKADPFPELASVWVCDGTVWALIPADKDALVYLECRGCRTRWDVTELEAAADHRLPVADAARLVGVHRDTVYRWAKQDRLTVDDDGLVQLREILCAVSA